MIDTPGIYYLSMEEYHSDPCVKPSLSRSSIKDLISRTPYHAWWNHPRLNPAFQPEDGNIKFDIGTASHSILLEGINNVAVIDAEDWRTKAAKEDRDMNRKKGKTPLLAHQFEEVKKCVLRVEEQIYGCPELGINNLMTDGDHEQSFFWTEGETWLRTRTDWISKDRKLILDCKFTEMSVNPSDLARYILNMGLEIQASLYQRGARNIFSISPQFVFVFAEVSEPYICSFVSLPPAFMALGENKVDWGIFKWRECMKKNEWMGYPNRVCYPDLPEWALVSWESKAMEMGVGK
jgi:hypothetical protein